LIEDTLPNKRLVVNGGSEKNVEKNDEIANGVYFAISSKFSTFLKGIQGDYVL